MKYRGLTINIALQERLPDTCTIKRITQAEMGKEYLNG